MRVFKYRGGAFSRDLKSLEDNVFWSPVRSQLNDPCEGLFEETTLAGQLDLIDCLFVKHTHSVKSSFEDVKIAIQNLFQFIDKSGVYSLSCTPLEELLWAHYAASHTGFCIEFDIDVLINYELNDYSILHVKYKEGPETITVDDFEEKKFLEKMFGIKSKVWEYEKEIRVITSASGTHNYDFRAVKAIYFGLRMPEIQKKELMQKLQGRGINYYQVQLKALSYKFEHVPVEDPFITATKYKYFIAPIAKGALAPEYVDEKYRPYVDYLYKAAEIVRREPDCNEVEMVEFSTSKGSIDNPVIFVQYKRKENRWVNHYLNLTEIDELYALIEDKTVHM